MGQWRSSGGIFPQLTQQLLNILFVIKLGDMKFPLLAQSDHLHFIPSPNRSRYCEDIWRNWLVEIWSYKLVTHRSGAYLLSQLWEAGSHTHPHDWDASIGGALLVIHLGWQAGTCGQLQHEGRNLNLMSSIWVPFHCPKWSLAFPVFPK